MAIYLGLGSNLGNRRDNLRQALAALTTAGVRIDRVSPVVESPALLPADAPASWNAPFLNLVVVCTTTLSPEELLAAAKRIEHALGRDNAERWSPRPIDIDILIYGTRDIRTSELTIPHPGLAERPFVTTPLAHLCAGLDLPGLGRAMPGLPARSTRRIPLWMGIVNLTPDSFTDGGQTETWRDIEARIDEMLAAGVHFIDFGAESTRPGATPLSADREWARLEPILGRVLAKLGADPLRPRLSVDTYHPEVAARALALGIDVINDVGGLTEDAMLGLAADHDAQFVAMHNLGLPADRERILPTGTSAADQVEAWLDARLERWTSAGLRLDRIIFDPGIGFGKNAVQSLDLLRNIGRFTQKPVRLLVGHSRKSFMHDFVSQAVHERDLVTIGGSMALIESGVDILRVHNVPDHVLAARGLAQFAAPA